MSHRNSISLFSYIGILGVGWANLGGECRGISGWISAQCVRRYKIHVVLALVLLLIGNRHAQGGIVEVKLTKSGMVRITGDAAANCIRLQVGEDGDLVLLASGDTELEWENERTNQLEVPGVKRIRVRLLGGKDRVSMQGNQTSPLKSLYIHAGNDSDFIEMEDVRVSGSYVIHGGNDGDLIVANLGDELVGRRPTFHGGAGFDELMGNVDGKERSIESRNVVPTLSRNDSTFNTAHIESKLNIGETVHVPAGSFPVRPIAMADDSRIIGAGPGISELRLEIDIPPGRYDPQHILSTKIPHVANGFTKNVYVGNLTLNGDYQQIDWRNVYNDGNAHGIYVRAAEDSLFEDIEIKNIWTDGIYVGTILGQDNNPRRVDFRNIEIHHAGRQGVSVAGGEDLTFDHFTVDSIGRDIDLHTSPRSAIDLEPEPNAGRFIRNISITHWDIHRVGQGVLLTGTGSSLPAENITVRHIVCRDLDGPQILAARDITNLIVENYRGEDHTTTGGVGVRFRNTSGTVNDLSIKNLQGTNFPLQIDGESDVELTDIIVEDANRSVLQIGGEPSQPTPNTRVKLDSFVFRNVGNTAGIPVVRVKSEGFVEMVNGEISEVGVVPYTLSLYTDVFFDQCAVESGQQAVLTPGLGGVAIGL